MTPNRKEIALRALAAVVAAERGMLLQSLRAAGWSVHERTSLRAMLRLARYDRRAVAHLEAFEKAVRPALIGYIAAVQRDGSLRTGLHADARCLVEHFDVHTERPVLAPAWRRMVCWARRNYRAWRARSHDEAASD